MMAMIQPIENCEARNVSSSSRINKPNVETLHTVKKAANMLKWKPDSWNMNYLHTQ